MTTLAARDVFDEPTIFQDLFLARIDNMLIRGLHSKVPSVGLSP